MDTKEILRHTGTRRSDTENRDGWEDVLIIYRMLPHYRKYFYEDLRKELAKHKINLTLVYSRSSTKSTLSQKNDEVDIPWAKRVPLKLIRLFGVELVWQNALPYLKNKKLVIVEQANKNIVNYLIFLARKWLGYKIAFWGHGLNLQSSPNSPGNIFKKYFLNITDWWFAYTKGVKEFLVKENVSSDKITVVQNSVYMPYRRYQKGLEPLRQQLGIKGKNVAIFCGGIYKEKRIDFLLKASLKIKKLIPDFELLVVGNGDESYKVKNASQEYPWIHYLGNKFGPEKAKIFGLANVLLMPGLVGLIVIDSFVYEVPLITTEFEFHSPEIEYIESGKNGIITQNELNDYVDAIVNYFHDQNQKNRLISGCEESSRIYTHEKMVQNFTNGIVSCVKSGKSKVKVGQVVNV